MTYFSQLGLAQFEFGDRVWLLGDLTKYVANFPKRFYNSTYLEDYYIRPGTRPDDAAYKLYDNVNYWWTFFIINNITHNEWPLDDPELLESMQTKYTDYELNSIVKYEDDDGVQVPAYGWPTFQVDGADQYYHFGRGENFLSSNPECGVTSSNQNAITLQDSLENENEALRTIKVVKPSRIIDFTRDFEAKVSSDITF